MTTYDWHHTYRTAVETFNGQTPGPDLEQQLLDTFTHSPQTVTNAIQKAGTAYKAGQISSPWGIVRAELNRISNQPTLTVEDTRSQHNAISRAEQWVRTTGLTLTETEVISTLFGTTEYTADLAYLEQLEIDTRKRPGRYLYDGLLKAAIRRTAEEGPQPIESSGGLLTDQDTPALRERILVIWRENQDRAEAHESDIIERAETWKAQHADQQARERVAVEVSPDSPPASAASTATAPEPLEEEIPF